MFTFCKLVLTVPNFSLVISTLQLKYRPAQPVLACFMQIDPERPLASTVAQHYSAQTELITIATKSRKNLKTE